MNILYLEFIFLKKQVIIIYSMYVLEEINMDDLRNKINELSTKCNIDKPETSIEVLSDTLYYRLTILRLGEDDNNIWWESSILSEVGRRNLERFFPSTFHKQRYDIARKIVYEKEKREIPEKNFRTLFNFGYDFETKIFKPFIKEIVEQDGWKDVLNILESIKGYKFNNSWVRDFYNIAKIPTINANGNQVDLGILQDKFYLHKELFKNTMEAFLSVYDKATPGNVVIPYYRKGMVI